jgi:hypothetical protein
MQTGSSLYDPTIIEQFAERLYEKASSWELRSAPRSARSR